MTDLKALDPYLPPAAKRVLENMQRGLHHKSNPCDSCVDSLCCAEAIVFLDHEEVQGRKYRVMTWQGKPVLLKEQGKCVYLTHDGKQARCSIYEDRPRLCREMDQYLCYLWAPGG